jgi:hypothetical protein
VLRGLKAGGSTKLLESVWKAYDRFCIEILRDMDCSREDEDLERDITEHLSLMISDVMTGYELSVFSTPLAATRLGIAQPPQYDIVSAAMQPRIMGH